MWRLAGLYVGLQRRLSVQFYGDIDHRTSFHQTVWRRVGPSACQIDTYRRTAPDYLVVIHRQLRLLLHGQCTRRESFPQQREGAVAVTTEHRIMNTCHQRSIGRNGLRQWNLHRLKLPCRIVQVQLVEHAMLPVPCQCRPVLTTELPTLRKQPPQIGSLRQFIAVNRLINPIAAHFVIRLAYWYHIDTFARFQRNFPIVLGYSRHHIVVRQRPARSHEAVLDPDVVVLLRKPIMRNGVLRENARMRLAVVMHDVALVVHDILNGHRRADHFARRTEMIELTAWQRHHSHRQRFQFWVINGRIGPQCTTEFRIQIIFAEIHAIGFSVARSAALLQQPHRLVA